MSYIPCISIIGASECGPKIYKQAEKLGNLIAQSGYTMVCGGLYNPSYSYESWTYAQLFDCIKGNIVWKGYGLLGELNIF